MKIIYVLRPELEKLPPCLSQIYALNNEQHEIKLVSIQISDYIKELFGDDKIKFSEVGGVKNDINPINKILNIIAFRKLLKKELKNNSDSLVWIGSVDTAIYCKDILEKCKHTVLNIYELYDQYPKTLRKLKNVAQKSKVVIVPEYNRAHILKVWLGLNRCPHVIENKPYIPSVEINKETLEIVKKLKKIEKKIILYQGWISAERDVSKIAESLKYIQNKDEYELILMGPLKEKDSLDTIKKIFPNILHIPFVKPPQHLFITELAYIGIATYDDSSLNTIFCAPNKIYEYAMKNVPILARDIPGLESTVGKYKIGICVDTNSIDSIANGILKIDKSHGMYRMNMKEFLDDCDIQKKVSAVIEMLNEELEG